MSLPADKVFRKALLDRLSSPEQINALMQVTNPRSWLALAGCALILLAALVWGVVGAVPSKLEGSGILIHKGGLSDVIAVAEGQLSSLEVEPGDIVKPGQIIARISQPELRQEVARLEAKLADLKVREQKAHELAAALAPAAPPAPSAAIPAVFPALRAFRRDQELEDTRRQLDLLRERLEAQARVTSSEAGRVVELRASVGDLVAPGIPIVSLERGGERAPLEALLYLDSRQGKALRPGMDVELVPSVARRERHGVLLGRVRSVESFPSTRQGMMRMLRNAELVDSFVQEAGGSPLAVHVELVPAPGAPSGYRWSSGSGPDLDLTSGTRCGAAVTTRTQRPIALVFPALDFGG